MRRQKVLITGGTGLLGQYLIRDLLLRGVEPVVLARPNKRMSAVSRVEKILRQWEKQLGVNLPLPAVVEGDVSSPGMGLSNSQLDWLGQHCDSVIHSAAVLQFTANGAEAEPWRTNYHGTRHVLEVTEKLGISNFHYVSTAYVCGQRTGKILENQLDCGQDFRNEYERSKFETEKLIHENHKIPTKTIYRPAVIVGDSQTGFTSTFHGLYLYLRLIATLVPMQQRNAQGRIETPIRLPMNGDEPRNLVPVDWVSQVITHLFSNPEAHGRTYHLSPDQCITARQVIDACCEYYNSCGVQFVGATQGCDEDNDFAARFFENSNIYRSYETSDPIFDKSNLSQFAGELKCPVIDKPMIWRFLEFGRSQRWGKRRETAVPVVLSKRPEVLAVPSEVLWGERQ